MSDTRLAKRARYESATGNIITTGAPPTDSKRTSPHATRGSSFEPAALTIAAMPLVFFPSLYPRRARLSSGATRTESVDVVVCNSSSDSSSSGSGSSDAMRALPSVMENHIVDFLSFDTLFALYGLYKGACADADRLWQRKQHLGHFHSSYDGDHVKMLWDAVSRCPVLRTISMKNSTYEETRLYALLCVHVRHLEVLHLEREPTKTVLFGGLLRQCVHLHTLRLDYEISAEEIRWLPAVLPQNCRNLRRLTLGGDAVLSTGVLLERLADAGVGLDELKLTDLCDARLLPIIARHPLRALDITLSGLREARELAADQSYVRATLPTSLRALQSTLTRLCIAYNIQDESVECVPIPLWCGLERLEAYGCLRFTAPLSPAVPTLRTLQLYMRADCDWSDAALLASLSRVYDLKIFNASAATFATRIQSVATAPATVVAATAATTAAATAVTTAAATTVVPLTSVTATAAAAEAKSSNALEKIEGAFLPGLRRLQCGEPVSLDRVLRLWPELVVLQADFDVEAQTLVVGGQQAPLLHTRLSKLSTLLLSTPLLTAWRFPNLRYFESTIEDVDDEWWVALRNCMAAFAGTLAVLKLNRSHRHEVKEIKEADPPPHIDWTVVFPRLTTAEFNLSLESRLSEITVIVERAPALEHLTVATAGSSGVSWLSTLGAPNGTFSRLRHLHCDTKTSADPLDPVTYECLMLTAPLLRSCGHLATFAGRQAE